MYGNDFTSNILDDLREQKRKNLAVAVHEPYFGRLDFEEEGTNNVLPLYIGKAGVEDEKKVTPSSSFLGGADCFSFYSFTGGEDTASYEIPSPTGLLRVSFVLSVI